MSNFSPLPIFITTLLLSSILTSAARPNPADDAPSVATQNKEALAGDVGCKGLVEEACLEKTTSDAQMDYIYTQPHPPQKP